MGRKVLLMTMDSRRLGHMACNPAVGGIGKSHIVKEVDALGGVMGLAIDATGIQFRRLNLSRGPAVWSTRAQADRIAYTRFVSDFVASQPGIEIVAATATRIIIEKNHVVGVETAAGERLGCRAVIVCSGTFLGGTIHIGSEQISAGRRGEPAAVQLSESLADLGLELGRLKTGTPPRLDGDTIDWEKCTVQPGDNPPPFFSSRSEPRELVQIPCHLTYTTAATRAYIMENSGSSPIFSGQIKSTGPRYCPSIEDKFYRFPDNEFHKLFLEPEGTGTNEVYPNGFSTALPREVQAAGIRTVDGLESAIITQHGYAIEYDYCPSHQIQASLETRAIPGLYLAGQINGTSGYEEAAGQGLMAGLNASLAIGGEPPLILDRSEAYIGVMIDDLCTRSTTEPYRMFTSRAEYRLALREDNARDRLIGYADQYGLLPKDEIATFRELQEETTAAISHFAANRVMIADLGEAGERFEKADRVTLENLLKQPHLAISQALALLTKFDKAYADQPEVLQRAAIQIRYRGYLEKQQREIDKHRSMEQMTIPAAFDYSRLNGLKAEALEKFIRFQPRSLGQAGRIEGVTPGDIAVLSVHLKRFQAESR
jgi:tRNA uridine 5-carboxymethylaminomethyl modification enzyme